jgi:hypothetical protein
LNVGSGIVPLMKLKPMTMCLPSSLSFQNELRE